MSKKSESEKNVENIASSYLLAIKATEHVPKIKAATHLCRQANA